MTREEFFLKIAQALSGCQLVEEQLKLYLSEALLLAKKCIGRRMVFNISGEDYEDASLERLIEIFRKLTDNDALVSELRKFKSERNFLSHRGIAHCLDMEGELFTSLAVEYEPRLAAIEVEAKRLLRAIHEEANTFRAELDFGEFPVNDRADR